MAVQYDEKDGWSNWIDLLKKNVVEVSDKINGLFDLINNGKIDPSKVKNWEKLFDKKGISESRDELKEFFTTAYQGGDVSEEYQQWMIANGKATSTFTNIASKAKDILKSFGASLASMAINMAIGMIIQGLSDLAHASEIARDKSTELTEIWEDEKKALDDITSRYKELSESLNSNTLSTEEVTSAKEELLSIQKDLIDKYGSEASGIDLVNGKYEEQLGLLNKITESKAKEYTAKNANNVEEDIEYLTKNFDLKANTGFTGWDSLDSEVNDILSKYENIWIQTSANGDNSVGKLQLRTAGSIEEVYDQLVNLYHDLDNLANDDAQSLADVISDVLENKFDTEAIENARNNVFQYAVADILDDSTTRELYDQAQQAVNAYNKALTSGEGVDEAKEKLDSVKLSIDNSIGSGALQDIYGASEVFDEIWKGISTGATESSDTLDDFANKTGISTETLNENINTALDSIQKSYDAVQEFKDALADKGLTDSVLDAVAGLSDELKALVAGFYAGAVSSDELFQALTDHYNNDLKNYSDALIAKHQNDIQFWNNIGLNSTKVTNKFLEDYGIDLSNHRTYAEKKAEIESKTLQKISDMWSDYYSTQTMTWTGLGEDLREKMWNGTATKADKVAYNAIAGTVANYKNAIAELDKITYSGIEASFEGISSSISNASSTASSSAKETEKTFDHIETKLSNMSDALSDLDSKVSDTYSAWTDRNNALAQSIDKTKEAINLQNQAYNAYMNMANSVGLDPTFAQWIREGKMSVDTVTDESLQKKADEYQTWYDKAQDCLNTQKELESSLNELNSTEFQNIQTEFEQNIESLEKQKELIEKTISLLSRPADYDTLRQSQENIIKELESEKVVLETELKGYGFNENSEEYKNLKGEIDALTIQIVEARQELLDIDGLEFDNLKQSFENVLSDLDSEYTRLENDITLLSSDSAYNGLRKAKEEQIALLEREKSLLTEIFNSSNFEKGSEEWYDMHSAILSVNEQLEEVKDGLVNISSIQFDNVSSFFDSQVSGFEGVVNLIQNEIDKLNLTGFFANEDYYNEMVSYSEDMLTALKSKYEQLYEIRKNSGYAIGTDEWNEMTQDLINVQKEISDTENQIIEFNNSARDLNWEIFDYLENSVSRLGDEMDYLIGLIGNEDLFDDKGSRTKYGDVAIALHAASYDVYRQQAQDYKEEMLDLQEQLVNGNMDVLEQYRKMEEAHRDAVNSANEEKQAILDLIQNGLEAQKNALQDVIDKRVELFDIEKSAYDYQKSITDQTKNVSDIRKQILANEGDTSETGKALAQQLKVQLEEAESALEETEYEKYLSDQRELLDSLTLEYEQWMNERMDNEDALLQEIIGGIAAESDEINATLNEVAEKNGTLISESITSIFEAESPFTNGLADISNGVAGTTTAINNLLAHVQGIVNPTESINNLIGKVEGIADILEAIKTEKEKETESSSSASSPTVNEVVNIPVTTPIVNTTPLITESVSQSPATVVTPPPVQPQTVVPAPSSSNDNIFIHKKDGYPKNKLNKENSVVDRCKYFDFASDFSSRAIYYSKLGGSGTYRGSASQNRWLIDKMKERGYKKGSKNIPFDQMNWVHDGEIILKRVSDDGLLMGLTQGSKVFTEEQSNALWNLSKMNMDAIRPNINIPTIPAMQSRQAESTPQIHDVNMTFELPNVKNTDDFINDMIRSKRFENVIHSITFGKNSMDKFKHLK